MLCRIKKKDNTCGHSAQTDDLSLLERTDHKRVRSEGFNKEALKRIEYEIESERLTIGSPFMPVEIAERYKEDNAPYGFVEKGRVDLHSVYEYAPWKIGRSAVSLAVEKVAPSADRLGECDRRNEEIEHIERMYAFVPADGINGKSSEYEPAVYGEPAASDVEHGRQGLIIVEIKEHIIDSCSDNAYREHPEGNVEHVIIRYAVAGCSFAGYKNCCEHAEGDEYAIPSDINAEYCERYRIGMSHYIYLRAAAAAVKKCCLSIPE